MASLLGRACLFAGVLCACGERFSAATDAGSDTGSGGAGTAGSGGSSSGSGGFGGGAGDGGSTSSGGTGGGAAAAGTGGVGGGSGSGGVSASGGSGGNGGTGGSGGSGFGGVSASGGSGGGTAGSGGSGGCTSTSPAVCVDCCKQKYPDSVLPLVNKLYGCACSSCYDICSSTLCDAIFSPSAECLQCLRASAGLGGCDGVPEICTTDPVCGSLWACTDQCF